MERLEIPLKKRIERIDRGPALLDIDDVIDLKKVFDRLAAYENTGLMPEDVTDLMAAHGTAILELSEYRSIGATEHLKELARAEKDRRLVVLPRKVGDTVWTNIAIVGDRYKSSDRPHPVEVVFIGMGEDKIFFHAQYSNGRLFPFDFDKFGKTVFMTREEAEAALKKREEADNEADCC